MVASSLVGLGSLGALLHIAGSVLIVFGQVLLQSDAVARLHPATAAAAAAVPPPAASRLPRLCPARRPASRLHMQ